MVAFKATPRKIYASMPLDQDTARVMFTADMAGHGRAGGCRGRRGRI